MAIAARAAPRAPPALPGPGRERVCEFDLAHLPAITGLLLDMRVAIARLLGLHRGYHTGRRTDREWPSSILAGFGGAGKLPADSPDAAM